MPRMQKNTFMMIVAVVFTFISAGTGLCADQAIEAGHEKMSVVKGMTTEKININKASAQELMQLKGIGEAYAERIVTHRSQAPFQSLEDLMDIRGIGPKTYEAIKDHITLE